LPIKPDRRLALFEAASEALYVSHKHTLAGPDHSEPYFVRDFAFEAAKSMFESWHDILSKGGVQLRVTSVFCHQTPKAHFSLNGSPVKPELGDVVVVHDHLGLNPRRRALIIQAKMEAHPVDKVQLSLYKDWPPFSLHGYGARHAKFATGNRSIGRNQFGACYAIIRRGAAPPPIVGNHLKPWTFRFVQPHLVASGGRSRDAAIVVTNMILGKSKSGRRAVALTPSDLSTLTHGGASIPSVGADLQWSITIQELINITGSRELSAKMQTTGQRLRRTFYSSMQHGILGLMSAAGDNYQFMSGVPSVSPETQKGVFISY